MKITGEKFYFTENVNEVVFEFTFKSWRMEGLDTRRAGDYLLNNFLGLKGIEFIRNDKNVITLRLTIEKDAKSYFERWQKKIDDFPAELRKAPQETYDAQKERFDNVIIDNGYIDINDAKDGIKQVLKNYIKYL